MVSGTNFLPNTSPFLNNVFIYQDPFLLVPSSRLLHFTCPHTKNTFTLFLIPVICSLSNHRTVGIKYRVKLKYCNHLEGLSTSTNKYWVWNSRGCTWLGLVQVLSQELCKINLNSELIRLACFLRWTRIHCSFHPLWGQWHFSEMGWPPLPTAEAVSPGPTLCLKSHTEARCQPSQNINGLLSVFELLRLSPHGFLLSLKPDLQPLYLTWMVTFLL